MILPLQAILLQFLLLLVSIAIEAVVLHRKLHLAHADSVKYSTSINLLSIVSGWLLFFVFQSQLSETVRLQLISYIFFNSVYLTFESLPAVISVLFTASFFLICLIEYKGLNLLQALLSTSKKSAEEQDSQRSSSVFKNLFRKALRSTNTSNALVILVANAWSHSAILVILFLRSAC